MPRHGQWLPDLRQVGEGFSLPARLREDRYRRRGGEQHFQTSYLVFKIRIEDVQKSRGYSPRSRTVAEFDEIKTALAKAQQTRERCKLELSELAAVPVIALHPEIAKTYRKQVMDLTGSLTSDERTTLQA